MVFGIRNINHMQASGGPFMADGIHNLAIRRPHRIDHATRPKRPEATHLPQHRDVSDVRDAQLAICSTNHSEASIR